MPRVTNLPVSRANMSQRSGTPRGCAFRIDFRLASHLLKEGQTEVLVMMGYVAGLLGFAIAIGFMALAVTVGESGALSSGKGEEHAD